MDNDIGSKIAKISKLLENKDILQTLAPLLSALTDKNNNQDNRSAASNNVTDVEYTPLNDDKSSDDITDNVPHYDEKSIFKPDSLFTPEKYDQTDSRITLLNCLKPFCCEERQKRINTCVQIMGFLKAADLFKRKD